MAKIFDNIHYSFREIDGYNKAINFIASPRELGKTTTFWYQKAYLGWKRNKKPWLYLVRQANEITEDLLEGILLPINKFTDDNVEFEYPRGGLESGVLDVKIKGELFFRVLALSNKIRRIKLSLIKNPAGVFMDEYIIDPKNQEKYQPNEAGKIKEIYTTYRREADGVLKMYFVANLYSLYNPIWLWLGVDTNKIREGITEGRDVILTGNNWLVQFKMLTPELREYILSNNPLYEFDKEYEKYALNGVPVNDQNIRIGDIPPSYRLQFVFRIQDKNIAIYQNNYFEDMEDRYHCSFIDEVGAKRVIYCFEFDQLINRGRVMSSDERSKLNRFKIAMRKRQVVFSSVAVYYLVEEIYNNL